MGEMTGAPLSVSVFAYSLGLVCPWRKQQSADSRSGRASKRSSIKLSTGDSGFPRRKKAFGPQVALGGCQRLTDSSTWLAGSTGTGATTNEHFFF